jgi:hypothetical protein
MSFAETVTRLRDADDLLSGAVVRRRVYRHPSTM